MTRNWKAYARILVAGIALQCNALPALANFDFNQATTGTITHMFSFDSGTTPAGTSNCAASSTECPASVPINTAGSPLFITSTPGIVAGPGTAGTPGGGVLSIQGVGSGTPVPISGNVTNAGTFAVQDATLATDIGAPGATACTTDTASCNTNQQMQRLAQRLSSLITAVGTPIQTTGGTVGLVAGSAIVGKFGIDQTTPGTTNGISIADILGNAALAGAGAVGTGSLRVAVGQDATTLAGSAKGLTIGAPVFDQITDGTNGPAAVKAASTAAAATDPALVVAVSPNNTIPIKVASAQIASGAVASGAVASGAIAAGALATGAGVDGWDITEGTKADAPCTVPTTTTACSLVAVMKAVANLSVGGNAAAGTTASAVPSSASYNGLNVSSNLRGQTGVALAGSLYAAQTDFSSMGGTAVASGCAAALNSFSTTIPSTVCGVFGTYVINSPPEGRQVSTSSSPVVPSAAPSTAGAIVPNNTTAVVVKGSAATLLSAQLYGIGSAPAYLKIYNATSATCGSGTPVKRLMIPAAPTAANGAGNNMVTFGPGGLSLGTGFTYCVTTGILDTDTTAPAASTYLVNLDYE